MYKLLARLLVICAVLAALGGCTRGTSDLHAWVAQEKAKKGPPLPPLPVIKTFESFTYKDQSLRDPFSPSPLEAGGYNSNGPRPDANRPKQPLEMFPLDSLRMVGTIGTGPDTGLDQGSDRRDPSRRDRQLHGSERRADHQGHAR